MKFSTVALAGTALGPAVVIIICAVVLIAFMLFVTIISRYKKCPPDKIMVISGKVGKAADGTSRPAKCIHGGAAFVLPVFQTYE